MKDKRLYIILLCGIVRMGIYGFSYYPLLDDYIQFGVYPNIPNAYIKLQLYRQRPLAGLFDIYVWSKNPDLSFFIITVLHCVSAYLLILVFNGCGIKAGLLFACCFVLCPLNTEASYWLSASVRIVFPVFIASLAAYFLSKEKYAPFYILFVVSILFYEQCAVFSFLLCGMTAISQKREHVLYPVFFIGCLIFSYYLWFAGGGLFGGRMSFGFSPESIKTFFKMLGLWNGLYVKGGFYLAAVILCCALLCTDSGGVSTKGVMWGAVFTACGVIPFLFLENPTIGFRSLFIPLIGLSLIADSVSGVKLRKLLTPVIAAVFILSSAYDLKEYRENYFADQKIIKYTAENVPAGGTVYGLPEYNVHSKKEFAQFIQGAASSDWAITGAVRLYKKEYNMPYYRLEK